MFSLVLFSGFFTLILGAPQYVFVNESKTWEEAQRYCRDKYTDLATIENEQQTFQLMDTVNDYSTDLAWIGLYDDLNSWNWTLEDTDFFKVEEKNFRNWNSPGPGNSGAQSLCVYMHFGIWYTASCSNAFYPTVCYDGRENASATYVIIYQSKTWTEAQSYCREHHTDLISIRNEVENQKIQYFIRNNYYYYYNIWIGLYRTRSWSDQSNSSFTYWSTWQPDTAGTCTAVSFRNSGKWTDENCNYAFPFFCHNASTSARQYHFVNESKTWTEAQSYCRQNYTDLATIENMEEMNRLINTVNGSYYGLAWIGQYDDVNSWRWSLEDNDFYQEGERDFRNWYHEPDNSGGNQLCVYMDSNGKWYDISCDNTLPFVCYDGRDTATQNYIFIYNRKTWSEARRYCRDYYTDLANVRIRLRTRGSLREHGDMESGSACTETEFGQTVRILHIKTGGHTFLCYMHNQTMAIINTLSMDISTALQYHSDIQADGQMRSVYPACLSSATATWTEAQRYCRQNYTDLATIDNMEEMNRLIKTVRGTYYGSTWIGLYDDMNSWRWSLDNAALGGGFKSWYIQQPVNSYGQSLCVYMSYYHGTWSEVSCYYTFPFVCYDGRVNASASYVLVYQSKTWNEAQSYCREHHTDLVSIRNEIENYRVQSLIPYNSVVWIGLYRTRSWSDQSNSSFSNWRTGQPDNAGNSEYCTAVSFSDSGNWTDENCNTALPFVCYSGE
ncbi:hypothetical protein cypCar_00046257 [Cyprinus carpio]|nr:hypothetical protein cypCar_00046257 [Cyprinus carpio]